MGLMFIAGTPYEFPFVYGSLRGQLSMFRELGARIQPVICVLVKYGALGNVPMPHSAAFRQKRPRVSYLVLGMASGLG
jgi:hypothetical protein